MKYLAYFEEEFKEFNNYGDLEYFLLDKPKTIKWKKITSKKMEKEFRESCLVEPERHPKIYVAILDGKIKRFNDWKECKAFIDKDKNTKYKSFTNENDAQAYININTRGRIGSNYIKCTVKNLDNKTDKEACVLSKEGTHIKSFFANELKAPTLNSRECETVIKAIEWAIDYNEECILIEYKNQGTEMWANGSWKTRAEFAKRYKDKIDILRNQINIEFREQK